ncbi:hypothetical protein [Campylobacter rectus]|nr:hypothetical protein [Campylobacter rectus]
MKRNLKKVERFFDKFGNVGGLRQKGQYAASPPRATRLSQSKF